MNLCNEALHHSFLICYQHLHCIFRRFDIKKKKRSKSMIRIFHHGALPATKTRIFVIILAAPLIQQLIGSGPNNASLLATAETLWEPYNGTHESTIDIGMGINVEDEYDNEDGDVDLQEDDEVLFVNNFRCSPKFCSNGNNCAHKNCRDCPYTCWRSGDTNKTCAFVRGDHITCATWCDGTADSCSNDKCADCLNCSPSDVSSGCPFGHFHDVTDQMMPSQWNEWRHSGKPFNHFSSPVMVDINGDSILDYFSSMHGGDSGMHERMEFGLARNISTRIEGEMINITQLSAVQGAIIMEERSAPEYKFLDCHGDNVVDLDNDGVLDIYIASGGARGVPIRDPMSRDQFLFFGEYDSKNLLTFRGGRKRALDAGVGMRLGRGDFNYLLDVNQDGLLDIFSAQARRVDNSVAPAVLLINQGDREWREDTNMTEFASTMMLTDADGDGRPEEFMIVRDFCFPKRNDPDNDDAFGPFGDEIRKFCSTRPVGTIAIYKYNKSKKTMQEISQPYKNISANKTAQMECCPHGFWNGQNDCSATSMASADVDGDMRSDHVFLYGRKLVFYFSTDRPQGTLPVGREHIGLTISLPSHCNKGIAVRFVDLNNNGRQDLLVVCRNVGTFLIYSQTKREKDSWHLKDGCNDRDGRLGDMTSFSSYEWSDADMLDACAKRDLWENQLGEICDRYTNTGKKPIPLVRGVTLADVNNDGLTDAIVVGEIGYQKVFLNTPSGHKKDSNGNKFVSFRLEGDGIEVNKYGIGVTLHLYMKGVQDAKQKKIQVREISSYQHSSDSRGSIDEKIIFGLGEKWAPMKLKAIWPNGRKQIIYLKRFNLSTSVSFISSMVEPIQVRYHPKNNQYFIIENLRSSGTGEKLCLSLGPGVEWKDLEVRKCISGSSEQYFKFDYNGRLRSLLYDDYCAVPRNTDYSVVMHLCSSRNARQISWHMTRDGSFFRLAGSSMVLALANAESGEKAKLLNLDKSKQEQRWELRKND